jgi:hypothetical protein
LVEEEICCQLFILVASKVSLDRLVLCETKSSEPLNGVALLFCHGDLVRSRGERCVIVTTRLAKKGQELIGVLGDQLGKLGVAGTKLLENGFQHLGLLLHHLPKLLELCVGTEPFEVTQALTTGRGGSGSGGGGACTRSSTCASATTTACTRATTTLLSGEIE